MKGALSWRWFKEEEDARGGRLGHRSANSLNGCRVSFPPQLCCVSLSVLLLLPCPVRLTTIGRRLPSYHLDPLFYVKKVLMETCTFKRWDISIYELHMHMHMQLVLNFFIWAIISPTPPHYSLPVNPGSRSSTALNLNPPQWGCTSGLEPHSSGRGGLGPLLAPSSVFTSGLQPQFPPTSCCFVQPPPAFIPPALIIQIYPYPNQLLLMMCIALL